MQPVSQRAAWEEEWTHEVDEWELEYQHTRWSAQQQPVSQLAAARVVSSVVVGQQEPVSQQPVREDHEGWLTFDVVPFRLSP